MAVHCIRRIDLWPLIRIALETPSGRFICQPNQFSVHQKTPDGMVLLAYDESKNLLSMSRYRRGSELSEMILLPIIYPRDVKLHSFDYDARMNMVVAFDKTYNLLYKNLNDPRLLIEPHVLKVAFSKNHCIFLCSEPMGDPADPWQRKLVVVLSRNSNNLLGQAVNSGDNSGGMQRMEVRFAAPIADLQCTIEDGSIVLDRANNVHMWGRFNPKMGDKYVRQKFAFTLNPFGTIRFVYCTSDYIIFLSTDGRVFFMSYREENFPPIQMLSADVVKYPVRNVFAKNTSKNCLLISQDQRILVWNVSLGNRAHIRALTFQSIPDAFCLYVHQGTPRKTTVAPPGSIWTMLQERLFSFNAVIGCYFNLSLGDGFIVRLDQKDFAQRLQRESLFIHRLYHKYGQNGQEFFERVGLFLNSYPVAVAYSFILYLFIGDIVIDDCYLEQLYMMTEQAETVSMHHAIDDKKRQIFAAYKQALQASRR